MSLLHVHLAMKTQGMHQRLCSHAIAPCDSGSARQMFFSHWYVQSQLQFLLVVMAKREISSWTVGNPNCRTTKTLRLARPVPPWKLSERALQVASNWMHGQKLRCLHERLVQHVRWVHSLRMFGGGMSLSFWTALMRFARSHHLHRLLLTQLTPIPVVMRPRGLLLLLLLPSK